MPDRRNRGVGIAGALLVTVLLGSGCSSKTIDKVKDAASSAKQDLHNAVDEGSARAGAEGIRLALVANARTEAGAGTATGNGAGAESVRSISALNKVVHDLPSPIEVRGIVDANHDGIDDDGNVEVVVNGKAACLRLPEQGTSINVENDSC